MLAETMTKVLGFLITLVGLSTSLGIAQTTDPALGLVSEIQKNYSETKWSDTLYKESPWKIYSEKTAQGRPLIYFVCGEGNKNTTLLLSSVHGDEVTPVYFGLRLVSWVKGEPDLCRDNKIIIVPIVNPDGALADKPTRMNSHGVDLNRNFKTADFEEKAVKLWKGQFKSDPRRFPGEVADSEVETRFQKWLITEYKPQKILSVHSPLGFFDYDGPEDAVAGAFQKEYLDSCKKLKIAVKQASGTYNFIKFGYFTGSLGNYAGKERGIPTLTLELPSTDAGKAKMYFEMLKKGTRALITHQMKD